MWQALKTQGINADTAEISFIGVSPKHQGKKIGTRLLDYVNRWSNNMNISYLQTKTANQELRRFYIARYQAHEVQSYNISNKEYSVLKWPTAQLDPE
jgi:GNAT superfamily N-acetyltransferase